MSTRSPDDAPAAIPYSVMPAYRAAAELKDAVELVVYRRIEPAGYGFGRALNERGTRILLAAAEGGARAPTWRRRLYYEYACSGILDLDHLLMRAAQANWFPEQTRTGVDIFFRMAQQAMTLAAGAMAEREDRERPVPREGGTED